MVDTQIDGVGMPKFGFKSFGREDLEPAHHIQENPKTLILVCFTCPYVDLGYFKLTLAWACCFELV